MAVPALAQEYSLKLSAQDTVDLGKALADKVKEAQAVLALVQKLQAQLDAQNKATTPVPGSNP